MYTKLQDSIPILGRHILTYENKYWHYCKTKGRFFDLYSSSYKALESVIISPCLNLKILLMKS